MVALLTMSRYAVKRVCLAFDSNKVTTHYSLHMPLVTLQLRYGTAYYSVWFLLHISQLSATMTTQWTHLVHGSCPKSFLDVTIYAVCVLSLSTYLEIKQCIANVFFPPNLLHRKLTMGIYWQEMLLRVIL